MVIISKKILKQFIDRFPAATNAVLQWYDRTKEADWSNLSELKKT